MPEWVYIIIILVIVIVIGIISGIRNANHSYTIGSGMFKNSNDNLEKGKHVDISDFEYYNKEDKLK